MQEKWKRRLVRVGIALGAVFLLLQVVPYGRGSINPPVRREPAWDSARTRDLARRACFDCHSNEVRRPWYAHIAPVSWVFQRHVDEGREALNFSEWDAPQKEAHEAAEEVEEGAMPLASYLLLHPEARLDPAEKADLVRGLRATIGSRK